MTKIKTSEATPIQLNWLVAKCEDRNVGVMTVQEQRERFMQNVAKNKDALSPQEKAAYAAILETFEPELCSIDPDDGYKAPLHRANSADYCTDPSLSWPIIERERIATSPAEGAWMAVPDRSKYPDCNAPWFFGPTGLIAAMRCFCASRLGDEVEIPEELA